MKYTKDFLEPIVKSCISYSELLKKLKLQNSGGNNSHIRKVIKRENIDVSHFKGQSWSKGIKFQPKYPIEDYLENKRKIHSSALRLRLIEENYLVNQCDNCGLNKWLGEPISLELHHKDKNHNNNNLSNLQILCPNCHSLIHKLDRDCHVEKVKKNKMEKEKIRKSQPKLHLRKVVRPPYEQLMLEIKNSNYSQVGKKYNVSDNAVRKWVFSYEKQQKVSPN